MHVAFCSSATGACLALFGDEYTVPPLLLLPREGAEADVEAQGRFTSRFVVSIWVDWLLKLSWRGSIFT